MSTCKLLPVQLGIVEIRWVVCNTPISRSLFKFTYIVGPVLSVRLHAPTEGVIAVKIEHFKVELVLESNLNIS